MSDPKDRDETRGTTDEPEPVPADVQADEPEPEADPNAEPEGGDDTELPSDPDKLREMTVRLLNAHKQGVREKQSLEDARRVNAALAARIAELERTGAATPPTPREDDDFAVLARVAPELAQSNDPRDIAVLAIAKRLLMTERNVGDGPTQAQLEAALPEDEVRAVQKMYRELGFRSLRDAWVYHEGLKSMNARKAKAKTDDTTRAEVERRRNGVREVRTREVTAREVALKSVMSADEYEAEMDRRDAAGKRKLFELRRAGKVTVH